MGPWRSSLIIINVAFTYATFLTSRAGAQHGWKVEGPRFGSQCPAPGQRPGWVLGAGGGRPLPLWGSGGITRGKFFENSDAKSCILVNTCCAVSCFLKTTAKKLGDQYIVAPNLKVGGSLPRSLRLLRLWYVLANNALPQKHSGSTVCLWAVPRQ